MNTQNIPTPMSSHALRTRREERGVTQLSLSSLPHNRLGEEVEDVLMH